MISLSREWSELSKAMYGQKFIKEFADFLKNYNIKTILECGCGDGNVLHGLAEKGFRGLGIDSDEEMIKMAVKNNYHANINYKLMSWLDLGSFQEQFDAVICRGNSISAVSWGTKNYFNPEQARRLVEKGIELMLKRIKPSGLFYIDTTSQQEIENGDKQFQVIFPGIEINATITYDWENRVRKTHGKGIVHEEFFEGGSNSYLITLDELESIIISMNPKRIWRPKLKTETNYDIICAIK